MYLHSSLWNKLVPSFLTFRGLVQMSSNASTLGEDPHRGGCGQFSRTYPWSWQPSIWTRIGWNSWEVEGLEGLEGGKMQSILYHTYSVPSKWSRAEADDIYPASIKFQTGLGPEHRDSKEVPWRRPWCHPPHLMLQSGIIPLPWLLQP